MTLQDDDGSFGRRLRSARARQKLDPQDRPARIPPFNAWSIGARVGVELLASLIVGTVAGLLLDRWLHTAPAFLIIGIPLGGAAGVVNLWRVMGPRKL